MTRQRWNRSWHRRIAVEPQAVGLVLAAHGSTSSGTTTSSTPSAAATTSGVTKVPQVIATALTAAPTTAALPAPFVASLDAAAQSSFNNAALGAILGVDKVTGQPFQDVLQQQILTPLGLTNSSFSDASPVIPAPIPLCTRCSRRTRRPPTPRMPWTGTPPSGRAPGG